MKINSLKDLNKITINPSLNAKLIGWGWCDSQGRSLTWQHWHEKRNRQAVAYLKQESGKLTAIFNVFRSGFTRGRAA